MARTVHRLDGIGSAVNGLGRVHEIAEGLPVSRGLPKRPVHELGCIDLLIACLEVHLAHVANQILEKCPAVGMPEDSAGRFFLKMKQVHYLAKTPMIALLGFLEHVQILAQLLVVRPCCAVDTLQHFVV